MFAVVVSELLKAVVCQMNIIVLVAETVIVRGSTHIAFLIDIKFMFVSEEGPDPQVEFPLSVEKWLF